MLTYITLKRTASPKEKTVRRVALFYIFGNLLNVWLTGSRLRSLTCFFMKHLVIGLVEAYEENLAHTGVYLEKG